MATRIQIEFPNLHNEIYNVIIDDTDYVGTAVEVDVADNGFSLQYANSEYVIGSKVVLSVIVTPDTTADMDSFLSDLLTAPEGRFTMKITRKATPASGAELFWAGYVLPDLSQYEDQEVYVFDITAADGLSRLKDVDFADTSGPDPVPHGDDTFLNHILTCLTDGPLSGQYWDVTDVFIRTVIHWNDNTIGAPAAAVCPTTRARINGEVFARRDSSGDGDGWKFSSCHYVLEHICKQFHARLYMSRGCYRLEQFNERANDTFYERAFSTSAALIGSSATAGYDKSINQTAGGFKISTVQFSFLPALKKVVVDYNHQTYKNYLDGLSHKWYAGSGENSPHTISNVSVDADTRFKITGRLMLDVEPDPLSGPFEYPWRYVFHLNVTLSGGHMLRRVTDAVLDGSGNGTNLISPGPVEWVIGTYAYEITTDFIWGDHYNGWIPFTILTPVVPAGTTSITVNFIDAWAENNTNVQQFATLNNWQVADLVLIVQGYDNADNYEVGREYTVANPVSGNSEVVEIDSLFGHAVKGWTSRKIQTSADGSTWTDTTATWKRGTEATTFEFGELLAAEIMGARRTPTKILSGQINGSAIFAHSRLTTLDDLGWIMRNGAYNARMGTWIGEWINAGINRITSGPIKKKKPYYSNDLIATPPPPIDVQVEGIAGPAFGKGNIALSALTTNYLDAALPAGTVTSIDLAFPVAENAYLAGDDIFVVNPATGDMHGMTVQTTASAGDTSLSIVSTTTNVDFPAGSHIVYSALNKTTNQGGGGTGAIPPGTATGQIMRWNGTAWVVYSGVTDGHVLTWDTVNGWQAEAASGGGSVNGSGTANRVAYWTASDTIAADDDFQFDGSGVGVGTGTMTGKFNVDAGSGFAQLPVNAYAAGSSVVYAQVSNTTTNAETWLSLNQEANINTIRGGLRRYGSTHGTFPNVIDLVNTQNAALRFITNNNIRLTISNAGAFTVTSVAGTGDRLIQADANGTLARSSIDPATLVSYSFTNGLTESAGTVKLGGTLTDATTTVNHNSNALRFYGGKFVIGGNSNYTPQTTIVGTSLTGSNLASVSLHVAASGGDNNAKISMGVGDAYSAGVGYFFTDQITRLYNMSSGGTLRLGIGGETSDKVVLQNANTIGRLGVGFANTTGMHSTLQSAGSFAAKVRDPGTSNYTITETDFIVARLTGTASPTWTLPSPTGLDGRMYILHNRGTGTVTLSASVSSNNGTTFNTLPASNFAIIYATNSTWYGIRLTSI